MTRRLGAIESDCYSLAAGIEGSMGNSIAVLHRILEFLLRVAGLACLNTYSGVLLLNARGSCTATA